MMEKKLCVNCKFLKKYTSANRQWVNVCEAVEAEEQEEYGLYYITAVDTKEFNASKCLMYKKG